MDKINTFIICPVRDDLIETCLKTIYEYTEKDTFYVIIVDQTIRGIDMSLRDRYKNLVIIRTPVTKTHHAGNLGFAKANNLGIQLVTTPYFTLVNDDVEFINSGWWKGTMDTFALVDKQTPDTPCMAVCPASVKLPDWSVGRPSGDDFYIIPYQEKYSQEQYDWLLNEPHYVNEHLTIQPGSVVDGITLYCPIFNTKRFLQVGLLDESYYPGGAEDYDYSCRAYMKGFRLVGTTLSWVFHHWSKTLSAANSGEIKETVDQELRMGDYAQVWGPDRLDIWGVKCPKCDERMKTADNKIAICPKDGATYDIPPQVVVPP